MKIPLNCFWLSSHVAVPWSQDSVSTPALTSSAEFSAASAGPVEPVVASPAALTIPLVANQFQPLLTR